MSGMKSKIGSFLDPGNIFGTREGGMDLGGMIAPSWGAKKGLDAEKDKKTAETTEKQKKAATAAKARAPHDAKLARYKKLKAGSTILSTDLEDY